VGGLAHDSEPRPAGQAGDRAGVRDHFILVQITDQAAHLDMVGAADDHRKIALGYKAVQAAVSMRHQGTGRFLHLQPARSQPLHYPVGGAVRGNHHPGRLYRRVHRGDAAHSRLLQPAQYLRIVDQLPQDRQIRPVRRVQRHCDGVPHPKTHPHLIGQYHPHRAIIPLVTWYC
jgi:hypothetical protein